MRENWKAIKDEKGKFKMVKSGSVTKSTDQELIDGIGLYSICYNNGYEKGYEDGRKYGYDVGWDDGYKAGCKDEYDEDYDEEDEDEDDEDFDDDDDDFDDDDDDFDPNDVATHNFGDDVTRCDHHTLRCDPDGFRCDPDGCNGCNEVLVTVTNGNFHTADGYCHVWSPTLKRIVNYKKLEED